MNTKPALNLESKNETNPAVNREEANLRLVDSPAPQPHGGISHFVAHELRSPIMSIRSGIELLKRRILQEKKTADDSAAKAFAEIYPEILKQLDRLEKVSRIVLNSRS